MYFKELQSSNIWLSCMTYPLPLSLSLLADHTVILLFKLDLYLMIDGNEHS